LLDFAIHSRQNETWIRKSTLVWAMHVHSALVTYQTDAIGSRKCDFGLPSHFLSPKQIQQQQSGNFPIPPLKVESMQALHHGAMRRMWDAFMLI
jgi:hypothetical protein